MINRHRRGMEWRGGTKRKRRGKIIVKRPTEKAIESFKMSEQERMASEDASLVN